MDFDEENDAYICENDDLGEVQLEEQNLEQRRTTAYVFRSGEESQHVLS